MNVRQLLVTASLAACIARPAFAQSGPPIPITAVVESPTARPGDTVRVALQIHVPPGLHIQANKVPDEFAIPTRLTIDTPAGITFVDVAFPASIPFRIEGFDEVQSVF